MEINGILKILLVAGVGSRRKLASAIMENRVRVNGEIVTSLNHIVDINTDQVEIDGVEVNISPETKIYLVLNKPTGVLSTTQDDRGRKTVIDFVPPHIKQIKLYPVGRLDMNSSGLVLLTNDGDVAYKLSHPSFEQEKEYVVKLDRVLEARDLKQLAEGVKLDDGITCPARVTVLEEGSVNEYGIVIHEGKKHIVRRLFARLGYVVLALKRIRIATIELGDLDLGNTRLLGEEEIARLKQGLKK
jgi:23S rRNA pseudouridine2605 synthase